MESRTTSSESKQHQPQNPGRDNLRDPFWKRWLLGSSLVTGILALCWLVLRSGTKPSRLAYPCQRAAMSTATLTLGLPLATGAFAVRRRLITWLRTPAGLLAVVTVLIATVALVSSLPGLGEYRGPILSAPAGYRAKLYNVRDCQVKPTGDRFIGLDNLIALMGRQGLKFYESPNVSLTSGPDGIIGSDDVVVIKINYQWAERGGTNVDLLSGLIRRIVDHPDSFAGEVVVCENAQFQSVQGFDRLENNASDKTRSPHDVVVDFQNLGYNVSHYNWTAIKQTSVSEYSSGDTTDGYIVYDYNPEVDGRVSYPKFQTEAGTSISLKYGIWDPIGETYDRDNLKYINVPVLKSHHAVYGATVSVKNYMGMVTDYLSTNSHYAVATGILGTAIAEILPADLNIIDAIYINAVPTAGPQTSYATATRRKELVACTDPVAADIWSVKNILIPGFIDNGYSPPWPAPSADPDDSTGAFRGYLDNSMYQLLAAGFTVTNDTTKIDAFLGNGRAGDFDEDADVDSADYYQFAACFTGAGGGPVDSVCLAGDFDDDGDVDCDDWQCFQFVWTDAAEVPSLPVCIAGVTPPGGSPGCGRISIVETYPNPTKDATQIAFSIGESGRVRMRVFDLRGRLVRTLLDEVCDAGVRTAVWDGLNQTGEQAASGVYFCQLDALGFMDSKRIVISR